MKAGAVLSKSVLKTCLTRTKYLCFFSLLVSFLSFLPVQMWSERSSHLISITINVTSTRNYIGLIHLPASKCINQQMATTQQIPQQIFSLQSPLLFSIVVFTLTSSFPSHVHSFVAFSSLCSYLSAIFTLTAGRRLTFAGVIIHNFYLEGQTKIKNLAMVSHMSSLQKFHFINVFLKQSL